MTTETVELVLTRCWCGMPHSVPSSLNEMQKRQHRDGEPQTSIYCPLGHTHVHSGEGEAMKLRRLLVQEQSKANTLSQELRVRTETLVRVTTESAKLKKRASAGICPCCNRTVSQMARHMKSKHPEFKV